MEIREHYLNKKAKFPPPKQHKVVIPPIDRLPEFDPSKVKKEMEEDKTKLLKKIPVPKKFLLAKVEPEKFFPVNESDSDEDWLEVSSFTAGVKDWYEANQKKEK